MADRGTTFVQPRRGTTKVVQGVPEDTLKRLKSDSDIESIETSKGEKIKEGSENLLIKEKVRELAKIVGKAVLDTLKRTGDEISFAKIRDITDDSFTVKVGYMGNYEDDFNFYLNSKGNKIYLVDKTFDKPLTDFSEVSGGLKIHVEVFQDAFQKHLEDIMASSQEDTAETTLDEAEVQFAQAKAEWQKTKSKESAANLIRAAARKKGPAFLEELQNAHARKKLGKQPLEDLFKVVVPVEQAAEATDLLQIYLKGRFIPMLPEGTYYFGLEQDAIEAVELLRGRGVELESTPLEEAEMGETDLIVMDVPLFIRILEYVKEDVSDDVEIHEIAQKAIEYGEKGKKSLSMQDYSSLIQKITNTKEVEQND